MRLAVGLRGPTNGEQRMLDDGDYVTFMGESINAGRFQDLRGTDSLRHAQKPQVGGVVARRLAVFGPLARLGQLSCAKIHRSRQPIRFRGIGR